MSIAEEVALRVLTDWGAYNPAEVLSADKQLAASIGGDEAIDPLEVFELLCNVAEVAEAAVRAEIPAAQGVPVSGVSAGQHAARGATVTPSREALIQAISEAESRIDDDGSWALPEDVADAILALHPGRSEAEVTRQWGRAFWTTNNVGEKVLFVDDQDGAFRDRADAAGMTNEAYDESPYDFVVFRDVTDWTISPRADLIERGEGRG